MAGEQEMRQYVSEKVESELRFIWQDKEVEIAHQYALAKARLTSVSRFSEIEDDKEIFKKTVSELCQIDSKTVDGKIAIADITSSWKAARTMGQAEMDKKAAKVASGSSVPDPLPNRPYQAMAQAFETEHGIKPDCELPGQPLMGLRLGMIETNLPTADQLTDLASLEDGEDEAVFAECDLSGVLRRSHRKSKKVPVPPGPEALRALYIVLENSWLYAKHKHFNTTWLSDFKPGVFEDLVKYLLGKKVYRLEAAADTNTVVPWNAVLKNEFHIRKLAMGLVKRGKTLAEAVKIAMTDSETRSLYFTSYITMHNNKRRSEGKGQGDDTNPTKWQKPGKGKGTNKTGKGNHDKGNNDKKKGKGKGKRQGIKGGLPITGSTPDGRLLCYKWNDGKSCDGSCGMLHACRVVDCHDPSHPMIQHPCFDEAKPWRSG